ncbi:MAG TPA: DNA primase, partial [Candidatus Omnitrophica bacterium]|nr:DNA primase [Candidatus Omnitrophota bacterium]
MMGLIPESTLEEILSRVDIVELISGYIPLKRIGRSYKALCPFHHEKTPSFIVNPDKQIFHCFGCSAGGNAFGFLMQHERLDFPEAIEALAKRTGVIIHEASAAERKTQNLGEQLYKIN